MEQKNDSGSLFRSDRARSERDPTHSGSGNAVCPRCHSRVEFYINGWVRTARSGLKYFGLSFRAKDASRPQQASNTQSMSNDDDVDPNLDSEF